VKTFDIVVGDIVAGGHKARVTLRLDGKGGFAGDIVSHDFGAGRISGLVTGDHLTGSVDLDGHAARFDAVVAGRMIAGTLTAGWFFSQGFRGGEAA
jgi:hypothetical protein